ncbi:hypothetical protein BCEP4_60120 [Burkholderia cepacia]|nr:hypothetical protein BCEP4_60120 [Burkholderia cepacia]
MGGWTRIWVVLTVLMSILAVWIYADSVRYAERQAKTDYENALSFYDNCRRDSSAPNSAPAGSSSLDEYIGQQSAQAGLPPSPAASATSAQQVDPFAGLCAGTDGPREQFAQREAQKMGYSIAAAKDAALAASVSIVGWASGTVGTLFLAVGWIRRGFRNKRHG